MPLNVRRGFASVSLICSGFLIAGAQTVPPTGDNPNNSANTAANSAPAAPAPTSGDVMRSRISKAKAFIAVRNYNAAIYELENIRRETNDTAVNSVVSVLLMNSYLEQGDYKRAQDFLGEFYKAQTVNKPNAAAQYLTVAAQVVKGARNQAERYRALGLVISDRSLPLEASVDIQKMRDTLETVIEQSKVIGKDKKQMPGAMALLEEATATRAGLAKDDYDAKHWKDEIGDVREEMASSNSVIINAANDVPADVNAVSNNSMTAAAIPNQNLPKVNPLTVEPTKTNDTNAIFKPVVNNNPTNSVNNTPPPQTTETQETTAKNVNSANETAAQNSNNQTAKNELAKNNPDNQNTTANPPARTRTVENTPTEPVSENKNNTAADTPKDDSPLRVGSLVSYATKKTNPNYPVAAKSMRATGVVTVEVLVDEAGEVSEIKKTDGPAILQSAAKDAIKKWKFKPFVRDGQPIKASGFVSFNFAL